MYCFSLKYITAIHRNGNYCHNKIITNTDRLQQLNATTQTLQRYFAYNFLF